MGYALPGIQHESYTHSVSPRGTDRNTRSAAPPRVFVTGMGVVSSVGLGKTDFFDALAAGRTGI